MSMTLAQFLENKESIQKKLEEAIHQAMLKFPQGAQEFFFGPKK